MTTSASYLPFLIWLQEKCDTNHDPLINEVSAEFPKEQVNKLFDKEFDKAYRRVIGNGMHLQDTASGLVVRLDRAGQQLTTFVAFQDYDWCGYIGTALVNVGIPRHDRDRAAARVVVQLLVNPGRLFNKWDGQRPLEARWRVAVRNAVKNARTSSLRHKK
jgi:hypothetical protein